MNVAAAAALPRELCDRLKRKAGLAILGRQYGEAMTMINAWSKFDLRFYSFDFFDPTGSSI